MCLALIVLWTAEGGCPYAIAARITTKAVSVGGGPATWFVAVFFLRLPQTQSTV